MQPLAQLFARDEIHQLAVRYALAIDCRDLDSPLRTPNQLPSSGPVRERAYVRFLDIIPVEQHAQFLRCLLHLELPAGVHLLGVLGTEGDGVGPGPVTLADELQCLGVSLPALCHQDFRQLLWRELLAQEILEGDEARGRPFGLPETPGAKVPLERRSSLEFMGS